jgi:hypothetical protein
MQPKISKDVYFKFVFKLNLACNQIWLNLQGDQLSLWLHHEIEPTKKKKKTAGTDTESKG